MTIRLDRPGATLLLLAAALTPAGCGDDELFALRSLSHGLAIRQEATLTVGKDGYITEVTVVGDLDGDGSDDALIRDGLFRGPGDYLKRGAFYVLYGGQPLTGEQPLAALPRLVHDQPWGGAGGMKTIAAAGDVDGDGLADLLVGAPDHCYNYRNGLVDGPGPWVIPPEAQYASVYIIYGSRTRFTGTTTLGQAGAQLRSSQPCVGEAGSVSGAGDVDGDGFADFVVTSSDDQAGDYSGVGRVLLFYGRAERWTGVSDLAQADASFVPPPGHLGLGRVATGVGDVDRDGRDDLMLSDVPAGFFPGRPELGTASIYLVLGSATRLAGEQVASAVAATTITGDVSGGYESAGVGDLDGDGAADFAVEAYGTEFREDRTAKYLFYGREGGLPAQLSTDDADARLRVAQPRWGMSPIGAGDVDDDGRLDLLVGDANLNDGAGGVYLLHGDGQRLAGDVELGERAVTYQGTTVRVPCPHTSDWDGQENCTSQEFVGPWIGVGDLTGDGLADLLASAPTLSGDLTATRAYLVAGQKP